MGAGEGFEGDGEGEGEGAVVGEGGGLEGWVAEDCVFEGLGACGWHGCVEW